MADIFIHQFYSGALGGFGLSDESPADYDEVFISRIAASLKRGLGAAGDGDGLWGTLAAKHGEFIAAAFDHDPPKVNEILSRMYTTPLTWGFQQDDKVFFDVQKTDGYNIHIHLNASDKLISLAEYLGVLPVQNPEQPQHEPFSDASPDEILIGIEAATGLSPRTPPYESCLYGLKTSYGIITDRHLIAMYVALRIRDIIGSGGTVCEIGGGMGYIAYYCRGLGITDYTIIDLPTVGAVQAYRLGTAIGTNHVFLSGERTQSDGVKIRNPADIPAYRYDILVNVDSFPEMATETARHYLRVISADHILTCNQESMFARTNDNDRMRRIGDLIAETGRYKREVRAPFWMRKGYVEEVFSRLGCQSSVSVPTSYRSEPSLSK